MLTQSMTYHQWPHRPSNKTASCMPTLTKNTLISNQFDSLQNAPKKSTSLKTKPFLNQKPNNISKFGKCNSELGSFMLQDDKQEKKVSKFGVFGDNEKPKVNL
jgi:hypothetical protein